MYNSRVCIQIGNLNSCYHPEEHLDFSLESQYHQESILGGGQTRFSKISLYLVLKGRKKFLGAFGAAKTLQLFIILPFWYIFELYVAYNTRILAKLLKTE